MTFGFSACSDDDEKAPESSSALIGTWERISCTYQYKENGEIVDEGKDEGNDLVGFKLVFKEDGTCKSAEYHTDKWDWFDEGKWSYSNGIITITDNNESELIKVKTLTDSQLIIETTDKYTEDGIFYEDYELTEYRKSNRDSSIFTSSDKFRNLTNKTLQEPESYWNITMKY